jgi:predicted metal-dependent HD superfamily phosphohydrolase
MKPQHYIPSEFLRAFWLVQTQKLVPLYSAPNRHYHNWHHVEKCLALVNTLNIDQGEKEILNVAFVYHDAIYIPGMKSEDLSSEMLYEDLEKWWAANDKKIRSKSNSLNEYIEAKLEINYISELIKLNPQYHTLLQPERIGFWETMKKLFDDVDYSILGAEWGEYRRYVDNVKKEYLQWCSEEVFWKGRKAFLENLLKKDLIFQSANASDIFNKFEKRARKNIADELITSNKDCVA